MMSEGTSHQKKFKSCSSERCIYAAASGSDVCYKHGAPKPKARKLHKTIKASNPIGTRGDGFASRAERMEEANGSGKIS